MTAEEMDPYERRRQRLGEFHTEMWGHVLEEAKRLRDERRADGWEAEFVMAAHTDTVSKDMKDHDRFGLMHIIPRNYADTFVEMYDEEAFTEYFAYGNAVEGVMYVVIDLIDPERERSILVPCEYDMTIADGLVTSAIEEGALYSYFKRIDGTILGTFRYEEFEPLVTPPNESETRS